MADKAPSFTIPVRGKEYTVEVNVHATDEGASASFSAKIGDAEIYAETLDKLRDKLMAETRRQAVKISIPFERLGQTRIGGWQVVRGTLTGIHARTREILYRDESGKADTMQRYASRQLLKPLDAETAATLIELHNERDRINKTIDHLMEANRLYGGQAVDEAIEAAADKA